MITKAKTDQIMESVGIKLARTNVEILFSIFELLQSEAQKPGDEGFDRGVQRAVEVLCKVCGVTDFTVAEGSEDHDTDLGNTMLNILQARGVYNGDDGQFASFPHEPALERMIALEEAAQEADIYATGATAQIAHHIATAIRALAGAQARASTEVKGDNDVAADTPADLPGGPSSIAESIQGRP